jgi:hypothetical protein
MFEPGVPKGGIHHVASDGPAGAGCPAAMGIRPVTVVPLPGAERTFSEPPSADRRSVMFWMPEPMAVES